MIMNETFAKQGGVGANRARQRSQMLGGLGIALVWHGDGADVFARSPFAQFADLIALEIVYLMPDAIGRTGGENRKTSPFDQNVATRRPRYIWRPQSDTFEKAPLQSESFGSKRRKTADAPTELPNVQARSGFLEALTAAAKLCEPTCRLEAEGDRQPLLAVRASRHQGIAMPSA